MRKNKGREFLAEGIEGIKELSLEKAREILEMEEDLGWLEYSLR